MKNIKLTTLLFLFITILISSNTAFSQSDTNEQESEVNTEKIEIIPLSDISLETEKVSQRIRKLQEVLKPVSKTEEIDSLLHNVYNGISQKQDTLLQQISYLSQRDLRKATVEWNNYRTDLKDNQQSIDSRIKTLHSLNDEVIIEINRWKGTKTNLTENSESTQLFTNIDTMVYRLQDVVEETLIRLDSIFIIQKKITELIIVIDEVTIAIDQAQLELQKDYFVFDNPAIWNVKDINRLTAETAQVDTLAAPAKIISGLSDDFNELGKFMGTNGQTLILQILFVLLLLTLLIAVKHKWRKGINDLTNPLEKEAKTVIANPVAASLSAGLLISAFFYSALIPIFSDILIVLILGCTAYLLPKLSHQKITLSLIIVLFIVFIQSLEIYINKESILARLLLLFNTLILAYALLNGKKVIQQHPDKFKGTSAFRRYVLPFYLVFLFTAFVANIIGMVNLSRFLTSAVITSVALGTVVYLSVKVFTSILVLLFKLRSHYNLSAVANLVVIIQKRIRPAFMLVGILVWLLFTLMGFEVLDYIKMWVNEILSINWKVGKMSISVGGLLSFTLIFTITLIITKIIANIFEDEWLIKVLPRGIAPAISLITRIVLITSGFYMALTAAGFDLSKIGLLLGALGVGIGFGLQNIVLNFISGLILAFERPINLGDAIEVDQEFGIVTSIGVRASNIKTYKGSEVIIPNGDLVSKKVVNWTLSNRDRRSRILMKTSSDADPEQVIALFNKIAAEHPNVYAHPAPYSLFFGYNNEGNLDFALMYWSSFSNTLDTDSDIALKIYKSLKEEGIQAPIPKWKIVGDENPSPLQAPNPA